MGQPKRKRISAFAILAMIVLILDTKTILSGMQDGVSIALNNIIPTLFPFIFVSAFLNTSLIGRRISLLRSIGRLCKIPKGAESLLLLGLIGGYPVGAKIISENYHLGLLDRNSARRMLGFCNNAGPSFLIGMLAPMFTNTASPYILWLIHILSAIVVGIIIPAESDSICTVRTIETTSLANALETSLRTVAVISGWVVLFRGFVAVCEKWFLNRMSPAISVILIGFLELSNGCIALTHIAEEHFRFVICSGMLAAGGICVALQSKSIVGSLGLGMYLPGKMLQTAISLLLSVLCSFPLYSEFRFHVPILASILIVSFGMLTVTCLYLYFFRKR